MFNKLGDGPVIVIYPDNGISDATGTRTGLVGKIVILENCETAIRSERNICEVKAEGFCVNCPHQTRTCRAKTAYLTGEINIISDIVRADRTHAIEQIESLPLKGESSCRNITEVGECRHAIHDIQDRGSLERSLLGFQKAFLGIAGKQLSVLHRNNAPCRILTCEFGS
ncbi:MAG: hypothetical protein Q8R76_06445 [Candidatus Omnitrophota bacterium]|nr:hypothetical protein [Candidatus Omnitrophota bacterium]